MTRNIGSGPLDEEELPEPPRLKWLRRAVMGLTIALTLSILFIAGALVWRVSNDSLAPRIPGPLEASQIVLPQGAEITALGGDSALLMVTVTDADGAERILAFDRRTGEPAGEVPVRRE